MPSYARGRVPSPSVTRTLAPVVLAVACVALIATMFAAAAKDRNAYDERRAAEVSALEAHYDVTITERPNYNLLDVWTIDGVDRSCAVIYPEGADSSDDDVDPTDLRLSCLPDENLVDLSDLTEKGTP